MSSGSGALNARVDSRSVRVGVLGRRENPCARATEILRQKEALTIEQFRELDHLLQKVSLSEFIALTENPDHQHQLRSYEVLSWRRVRPASRIVWLALIVSLFVGSAFAALY